MESGIFQRCILLRELSHTQSPRVDESLPIGESIVESLRGFGLAYGAGVLCLIFEISAHRLKKREKCRRVDDVQRYRHDELFYLRRNTGRTMLSNEWLVDPEPVDYNYPRRCFRTPYVVESHVHRQYQLRQALLEATLLHAWPSNRLRRASRSLANA